MITAEQAIKSLKKKLELIDSIATVDDFKRWKQPTRMTLIRIYGEKDESVVELSRIVAYHDYAGLAGLERTPKAKDEAKSFLSGLIENLHDFGLTQKTGVKNASGINVNVNQHSSQKQSTNVSINLELFTEAIKDELTGGQVKELKAILEGDEEPPQKKKSFVKKILSFGGDVSNNILANIVTSPQVFEQLGGML